MFSSRVQLCKSNKINLAYSRDQSSTKQAETNKVFGRIEKVISRELSRGLHRSILRTNAICLTEIQVWYKLQHRVARTYLIRSYIVIELRTAELYAKRRYFLQWHMLTTSAIHNASEISVLFVGRPLFMWI